MPVTSFVMVSFGYKSGKAIQVVSSQKMTAPGVSSISAPPALGYKNPTVSFFGAGWFYFAIGQNPDATKDPRGFYDAGYSNGNGPWEIEVQPGDKFSWAPTDP
ncbi:hypothetical protein [Bradyrhizobium sp. LTSP849]|uniref:hypothetical protein n=1 Tax=Bradyrhizobium sp. LTSP849 TaxID=1615890 RepID=UPI000A798EF6|nr:hypothetical protein [Bradyrhizobium sp. LTSP849]